MLYILSLVSSRSLLLQANSRKIQFFNVSTDPSNNANVSLQGNKQPPRSIQTLLYLDANRQLKLKIAVVSAVVYR